MAYPPNTFATMPAGNVNASLLDENFQAAAPLASPHFTGSPTAITPPVGNSSTRLATTAFVATSGIIQRSYLAGMTLSNDGGSPNTVLDIAAGQATDSINAASIILTAWTKTTAGAWVAGTGNAGMGQGLTIAATTWYHVFAIINTALADVYFDTSVSAANKPANTTAFRRIGSFLTDGSAHIIAFSQNGDEFLWVTPVSNINDTGVAFPTVLTLQTMTVPTGVAVNALFGVAMGAISQFEISYSTPVQTGASNPTLLPNGTANPGGGSAAYSIRTNTSGQIQWIAGSAGTNQTRIMATYGWIDTRGRNL